MKKLILILAFLPLFATAQFEVSIYQDCKLASLADDYGNMPFTLDVLAKITFKGKYLYGSINYEYAQIKRDYNRVSLSVGGFYRWEFIEVKQDINTGYIIHDKYRGYSMGADSELSLIIHKFKVNTLMQITDRTDINVVRVSFFVGLTYML